MSTGRDLAVVPADPTFRTGSEPYTPLVASLELAVAIEFSRAWLARLLQAMMR
jgi:hypothetical protein